MPIAVHAVSEIHRSITYLGPLGPCARETHVCVTVYGCIVPLRGAAQWPGASVAGVRVPVGVARLRTLIIVMRLRILCIGLIAGPGPPLDSGLAAVTARQTAGSGLSHRAFLQHGLWCSHQHAGEVRNIIMLSLALSALSVPAVRLPALRATLRCQRPPAMQTAHQPPALHSRRA